jgi:hypothetical protein
MFRFSLGEYPLLNHEEGEDETLDIEEIVA